MESEEEQQKESISIIISIIFIIIEVISLAFLIVNTCAYLKLPNRNKDVYLSMTFFFMNLTLIARIASSVVAIVNQSTRDYETKFNTPNCMEYSHQILPFSLFSIPLVTVSLRFFHIAKVHRNLRDYEWTNPNLYLRKPHS